MVRKALGLMDIGPPWGHTRWVTRWVTFFCRTAAILKVQVKNLV